MATGSAPSFPALGADAAAEVCVIGAGIAGLSTAYLLASEGRSVVVVDDGTIGGGQTKRTTAHLSNAIDDRFTEIERLHGRENARLAAESHTAAIDRIEAIVGQERIDCDFERLDGYLCLGPAQPPLLLEAELRAARGAGLSDVELLDLAPAAGLGGPCLRFPRQAQFHPLRYLEGLAEAAARRGARIFTDTHVESIADGDLLRARTRRGPSILAKFVVVATHTPIHQRVAVHTKQIAYRSYAIAMPVAPGAVPRALYWDTLDPYHYVRLQSARSVDPESDGELLVVGGEDHRIGPLSSPEATRRYERLEAWARQRFPTLGEVVHQWSGQVMEPFDGLAFLGASPGGPERVYLATGDSGMGLTHGTIAGMLLADLVAGRENPWAKLYDPSRKPLRAAAAFVRGNLESAACYAEWLTRGQGAIDSVAPDCGIVVRRGLRRLAVYRDPAGELHVLSAVCPHLGGIVGWNDAEKTWDCPCHGSRFDRRGRVVQGPANADLVEASLD
jgi:glycine/D-amino acid oxidase-like deaminating enzyme/nitrite reductase/ring-hydroxylating ferredoxin subunit